MTPQVTFEIRGTLLPGIVNEHFSCLAYLKYGVVIRVGLIFR